MPPQNSIRGAERKCGIPSAVASSVSRTVGTGITKAWLSLAISVTGISAPGRLPPIRDYTFASVTLSPRLGLRANIVSGDHNPNDPTLETFNPLFPKGKYFGEIGLIGPYNLINAHPTLTLQLNKDWTLDLATVFYWRESLGDGGSGGDLVRPSDDSRSRYIGTQADVILGWQPVPWFSAALSYSVFVPGQFIRDTGPSKTAHFVGVEAMLKF
jgi:hypothetical protein